MRLLTTALLALSVMPLAYADCITEVARTQERIEAMTGGLDTRQQIELTALLLDLCQQREPGSGVVHGAERTAITTHGLNTRERDIDCVDQDVPLVIGVDVDADRSRKRRPDRPERME